MRTNENGPPTGCRFVISRNDYACNNALTKIKKHLLHFRQSSARLDVFYFFGKNEW